MPQRLMVLEYEKERTDKEDSRERTSLFAFIKFNMICETFMHEAFQIRLSISLFF